MSDSSVIPNQTFIEDVAVVIPSYNEGSQILSVVKSISKNFKNIIVVDDGSSDNTFDILRTQPIKVIRHPINLGQGAALQTGIIKALTFSEINFILTFDADGQHSINSAIQMVEIAKKAKVDLVLGSRFIRNTHEGMPKKKKLILKLGIIYTRLDTGLKVTDAHNGLRIMSRNFASSLSLRKFGMAHASEILRHAKITRSSWVEAPAQIYYTDYSISKGQSIFNAINIFTEMIQK